MRLLPLLALVTLAACDSDGFAVDLTLRFDASVTDAKIGTVDQLVFTGDGDELYTFTMTFDRPLQRTERLVYRPSSNTRDLTVSIVAVSLGSDVAHGTTGLLHLTAGETDTVDVSLAEGGPPNNDLAGVDLQGVDLGSPDLSSSDLAFVCPTGGACEEFEPATSTWSIAIDANGGSIVPDSLHVHRGVAALHIHTPAYAVGDIGLFSATEPTHWVQGKSYWARAYYWADSPLQQNKAILFEVSNGSDSMGLRFSSTTKFLGQHNYLGGQNLYQESPFPLPADRWVCIEWHVPLGSNVPVTTYVDGAAIQAGVLNQTTQVTPAVNDFMVGVNTHGAEVSDGTGHDFWIDDVVLSTARVGCF